MSGTLGGAPIARASVTVPAWGRHWADVALPTPTELTIGSTQALVIASTSIVVTVVAGGALHGKAAYRVVGGKNGWGNEIPAKSYANDAEVKASSVLADAAAACGETIADLPTGRLGPHFARMKGAANLVLHELAPRGWYVDFAGVTRIGQRPRTTYQGNAPRTRVDVARQVVDLAVEDVSDLVPGVVVDGIGPAVDVEYILEPERLTARIYGGPATTSRLTGALLKIVETITARDRYRGTFEFRVVTQDGDRLNLQPVRVSSGMADLARVPIRPGVAGFKGNVQLGELVLVQFADGDPSRPQVTNHDAPDSPGWMPLTIEAGGPGALAVARETDTLTAGPFGGAINPRPGAKVKAV